MPAWLTSYLAAYVGQTVGYLAAAGLVFLLTWRWGARALASRRITTRGRRFDGAQLRHELRNTAIVLAVGTAQALLVQAGFERGWTRLTDGPVPGGPPAAAAMLVGLVLFNDLWFYSVHRALHTPWLFKHIHAVHHQSVDVNPFSSYSFHVVEAALMTAWLLPVAAYVPLPLSVLMAAQGVGLANNLMAHLGYELLPAWWARAPVLRWSNSATFHSLHHAHYNGNYGLFTRLWDRWLGTELPQYEVAFAAAHAAQEPSCEA